MLSVGERGDLEGAQRRGDVGLENGGAEPAGAAGYIQALTSRASEPVVCASGVVSVGSKARAFGAVLAGVRSGFYLISPPAQPL